MFDGIVLNEKSDGKIKMTGAREKEYVRVCLCKEEVEARGTLKM